MIILLYFFLILGICGWVWQTRSRWSC